MNPSFLLINPPVYDFAAYDLWAKPWGLLVIAAILKNHGAHVDLLDYMDRNFAGMRVSRTNAWGCGSYQKQEIAKPEILKGVARKYSRYGISKEAAEKFIKSRKKPDAVLVSSGMTYWYPGVQETISSIQAIFPGVPVILGGVYATLCTEHATKNSGADHVIPGDALSKLFELMRSLNILNIDPKEADFHNFPFINYECYPVLNYAVIRASLGCPFKCSYCAIRKLSPDKCAWKETRAIASEIKAIFQNRKVRNFAFYDDALLYDAQNHFIPLAEIISSECPDCNFHSPNGLHARFINFEVAQMMKKSRFISPRLSLETTNRNKQVSTGGKISNNEFMEAVENLKKAGYGQGEYICYLLVGIPEQSLEEVEDAVMFAHNAGAVVSLSEYSPIPGTEDWEKVKHQLPSLDPLWQNNSLFPLCRIEEWSRINAIKNRARELNQKLLHAT